MACLHGNPTKEPFACLQASWLSVMPAKPCTMPMLKAAHASRLAVHTLSGPYCLQGDACGAQCGRRQGVEA